MNHSHRHPQHVLKDTPAHEYIEPEPVVVDWFQVEYMEKLNAAKRYLSIRGIDRGQSDSCHVYTNSAGKVTSHE